MARSFAEAGGEAAGIQDFAAGLCDGGDCGVCAERFGGDKPSRVKDLGMTFQAVVVRFGLRDAPVKREILRYACKTATLRTTPCFTNTYRDAWV